MSPERQPEQQTMEELLADLLSSPKSIDRVKETPLHWLSDAQQGELGIEQFDYSRLKAGIELGRRIAAAEHNEKPTKITGSSMAIEFCKREFARIINESKQELFFAVTLNSKNEHISTHQVSVGTLDATLVHPREVFRAAIRDAAASIIVAHNHPSGDPKPSDEDFAVTRRLEEAGKIIGVDVLDHIVMARRGCKSIREER